MRHDLLLLAASVVLATTTSAAGVPHKKRRRKLSAEETDFFECPTGFARHGTSCYAFADGPSSKTSAAVVCEEYGAMLACPQSDADAQLLGQLATAKGKDYWIGATDVMQEGTWVFPCGAANFTQPWCPGEPNDSGGGTDGDCVRIIGRQGTTTVHGLMRPGDQDRTYRCGMGEWADHDCEANKDNDHQPIGFICEINPAKQEEWWEDDDDDEDEEGESDRGGGDGNPAAVFFAVAGCLGCVVMAVVNVVLWKRLRPEARPIVHTSAAGGMMPSVGAAEPTPYRAPNAA